MADRRRFSRPGRILAAIAIWPVRTLSRVTPDGALFLTILLLCGLSSVGANNWSNIPLLFSFVLLSLWLLALWHGTRCLRNIQFRRQCTERIFANDPLHVTVVLTNASRIPAAGVLVSEELEAETGSLEPEPAAETASAAGTPARPPLPPPSASASSSSSSAGTARVAAARATTFLTIISGRQQERATYTMVIRRRGIYRFSDTRLETVFPLGFFQTILSRRAPGRLVVYPRLGEVDTAFFKELEHSLQFIRRARPSRAEEDFRSLREYRAGDNPKWIHWRSSARLQKLLVKEFEEPQAKRVVMVIDTNLQRLGNRRFAAFELALSFAGTVARDLLRRGCEVQCVALQPYGRVARTSVSRERRNLDALLELLAGLRRDDSRSIADLREYLPRHTLRNAYVLVLGLGSIRVRTNFAWLNTADNAVRIFDARGEEFQQIFRRTGSSGREDISDEDVFLGLGDEEAVEEEAPAGGVA